MAIWQFYIRLVPRASIVARFASLPSSMSREQYETTNWWQAFTHEATLIDDLSKLLPQRESWTPALRGWGSEEGNRIDLWHDGSSLDELVAQVDARDPERFISDVASLAVRYELLGVTDDYEVRELSPQQLSLMIQKSRAGKFVLDPKAYLKSLDGRERFNLE